MSHDESPTARALLLLELLQGNPGITAARLAARLGVSERAARRYVGILREAGIPVESTRGPHGGYRIGRGLRLPPLMFTPTEALGLVMAVLEGRPDAADPAGPVGAALGKLLRALPEPVAHPAEAVRRAGTRGASDAVVRPDPDTTSSLVQAAAAHRCVRLGYRLGPRDERAMEVDPWAVVVHHGRWYLLCWSHTRRARRVLRVDRVATVTVLPDTFEPPTGLRPVETLEEHLSQGWTHRVEIVIEAPVARVAEWLPRSLGRPVPVDEHTTRLLATTDEPDWYAEQLTAIRAPFRIVAPPELREAALALGRRLAEAAGTVDSGATFD
ncbi:helix-turn-helix transcriptional regulator [Streptomyces chartreusis]|uniref:helix-turn-helix transcriptional regulator n=1 Tax=Streptomyces TaxID=1883 RepID=UPI0008990B96|nr:WYL domain-containing protein [Streptomyces sp. PAN_FS17]SED05804.1 Predicted DNA-binding transcriptional regulator YafY, contains an HTH and WYL domains [Streptomyces sp. PAN_FS17]